MPSELRVQASVASHPSWKPIIRIQHGKLDCTNKVFSSLAVMQSVAVALTVGSVSTVHAGIASASMRGS